MTADRFWERSLLIRYPGAYGGSEVGSIVGGMVGPPVIGGIVGGIVGEVVGADAVSKIGLDEKAKKVMRLPMWLRHLTLTNYIAIGRPAYIFWWLEGVLLFVHDGIENSVGL